jgi:hypothetical protein
VPKLSRCPLRGNIFASQSVKNRQQATSGDAERHYGTLANTLDPCDEGSLHHRGYSRPFAIVLRDAKGGFGV